MNTKGYIHIYTGNGKGKTTAALGLALRAAGAGKKTFFAQFVKGRTYSEIKAVKRSVPEITIRQYGLECFIVDTPADKDIQAAREGLTEVAEILVAGQYDLVVLDEANIAVYYDLFSAKDLIEVLKKRKKETEIVITGRYAPSELTDIADLVTEMKEVRHYFNKGVQARAGIEY